MTLEGRLIFLGGGGGAIRAVEALRFVSAWEGEFAMVRRFSCTTFSG
jgi:hypothetical protein